MKLLTKEKQESYENAKICYIDNKKLKINMWKIKNCHYAGECRGATYIICNLKHSIPLRNSFRFHNRCNYDYRFILKDLADLKSNLLV